MEKEVYIMMKNKQDIHWWFAGKKNIVCALFEKYCWKQKRDEAKILDIGCGMGGMLEALSKYGDVYGCDVEPMALDYCKNKWKDKVSMASLPEDKIYKPKQFDCIIALDVLEHIQDDDAILQYIYTIMKNGARLIITVPAQMRQWTYNDEIVHHFRRYELDELKQKVENCGLKIEKLSFYNSIMYPMIVFVRKLKKVLGIRKADIGINTKNSICNRILKAVFSSEATFLLKHNFKYGVSLILVAKKEGEEGDRVV